MSIVHPFNAQKHFVANNNISQKHYWSCRRDFYLSLSINWINNGSLFIVSFFAVLESLVTTKVIGGYFWENGVKALTYPILYCIVLFIDHIIDMKDTDTNTFFKRQTINAHQTGK